MFKRKKTEQGNSPEQRIKKVYTARDSVEADMVINLLKENGIPAMRQDLGNGGLMKLYGGSSRFGADIYTAETNAERAAELLEGICNGADEE